MLQPAIIGHTYPTLGAEGRTSYKVTWVDIKNARADSRFATIQWEMGLLCNSVSYWLIANLESALNAEQNYNEKWTLAFTGISWASLENICWSAKVFSRSWKMRKIHTFIIKISPTDVLALLNTRPSTCIMMTKFGSSVEMGLGITATS